MKYKFGPVFIQHRMLMPSIFHLMINNYDTLLTSVTLGASQAHLGPYSRWQLSTFTEELRFPYSPHRHYLRPALFGYDLLPPQSSCWFWATFSRIVISQYFYVVSVIPDYLITSSSHGYLTKFKNCNFTHINLQAFASGY